MNIIEHKLSYLQNETQFIAFTYDGALIASCNTLFNITIERRKLFESIPFLESIKDVLINIPDGEKVNFPCVSDDLYGNDGYFDFIFKKALVDEKEAILWIIYDFTEHYEHLISLQQQRNDSEIKGEFLEIEKKNIRLENELLEYKNKELERIQKIKSQFYTNMSHEIRTPVSGIVGLTKLISENKGQEGNYFEALSATASHLTSIVNDVLDLSKIESGKIQFEKVNFNLKKVVQNVVNSFVYPSQSKGIDLLYSIDAQVPENVLGDQAKLSQVLYNLLGNAMKFTEAGRVGIYVGYNPSGLENKAVFSFDVVDTGIGIAEKKITTIFDPYEQAEDNTTRLYGGTGLGLNIVKQLIELQGGDINVSSEVGKGTKFTVRITYEIGNSPDKITEKIANINLGKEVRVLVGEDDLLNQKVMGELLDKWGCDHTIVGTGKALLKILESRKFDLLILDYRLPDMNGFQVSSFLKNEHQGANQDLPIIILSGETDKGIYEKIMALGVNAFLLKPIDPETLKSQISALNLKPIITDMKFDVDLSYLEDIMDGDEQKVAEMVSIFIDSVPEQVSSMITLLQNQDWEALQQAVHQSKSNFKYVGVKSAGKILDQLEDDIKNRVNMASYGEVIKQVRQIMEESINYLTKKGFR